MWISREPWRTGTAEATRGVGARGILATTAKGSMQQIAFIDVHTTCGDIAGIVGPPLLADAVGFILIRFAVRVGTTAHVLAGLLAGHSRRRSHVASLAVAAIGARSVQALRMRSTGLGMRATLIDVHTARADGLESIEAEALILNTFRIVGAIEVGAAQDVHIRGLTTILGIGFAFVSLGTLAAVAGHGILTDRVFAAWFIQCGAFINIDTTAERIARVVWFARANKTADGIGTDGVISARIILALVDVYARKTTRSSAREGGVNREGK